MKELNSKKIAGLSIIAVLMIIFATFSVWLNNYIFNEEAFVAETVEVATSEEVRYAISSEIVDESLVEYPVANRIFATPLTKALAGMLDSTLAEKAVKELASQTYVIVTSSDPESVVIDTTSVKSVIGPIIVALDPGAAKDVKNMNIPDKIVLIDATNFPNISWMTNLIWIGQILAIVGVGTMAMMIWVARKDRKTEAMVLKTFGLTLGVLALVSAMIIPAIEPTIVAYGTSYNTRLIISVVYQNFTNIIAGWYWALALVGVLFVAAGFGYEFYVDNYQETNKKK